MSKQVSEYVVIRDGFWQGIVGDLFMYGCLLGLYWFNFNYFGNNGVLNVIFTVIAVMFIAGLFATYKHKFYSKEEAIEYLKGLK